MSIFGNLSGLLSGGALSDETKGSIGNALMGVLKDQGINGVPGLLEKFQQSGLGAQAASWVGTGSNLPVSAGHIVQALGPGVIGAIAGRFGIDPAQANQLLSQHLPGIVDHMTPDGNVPDKAQADESDDADDDDDAPDNKAK